MFSNRTRGRCWRHTLLEACVCSRAWKVRQTYVLRLVPSCGWGAGGSGGRTRTHFHTNTHRIRSHQPPRRIFSVIPHGRESRRACVSDVFSSESLRVATQRLFFFFCHPSCSSSKPPLLPLPPPFPPRAAFLYLQVQSSLCPLVLSSMQFYSVSSPPPSHPIISCIPPPLPAHDTPPHLSSA